MRIDVMGMAVFIVLVLASGHTAAQQSPKGSAPMAPPAQQAAASTTPAEEPSAGAPSPGPDADAERTAQELRTVMQSERRDLVNQLMDLTPEEHAKFWPVYTQYRADMTRVNNRMFVLIRDFVGDFDTLTDEKAQGLLSEHLSIEDAAHRLKRSYVDRFALVLPPKKVARFYQIDNKLDAVLRAELAKDIPLVR
jgi:hypothetical protein